MGALKNIDLSCYFTRQSSYPTLARKGQFRSWAVAEGHIAMLHEYENCTML